jgi:hypothetical protein
VNVHVGVNADSDEEKKFNEIDTRTGSSFSKSFLEKKNWSDFLFRPEKRKKEKN